ncbi:MAG: hypothetical protein R3B09_25950 [Nannocystaceae bacterium]
MNVLSYVLALAVAGAPSSPTTCSRTDHRCKARDYERKAARADAALDRATYLLGAHRSYWFLYQETEAAADLCAARRTLEASLAVEGQPERQRTDARTELSRLASIARDRGVRCGDRRQPTKSAPPPKLATPSPAQEPTPPAADEGAASSITAATAPPLSKEQVESTRPSVELMPLVAGPRHPFVALGAASPPGGDRGPEAHRPGRPLVIVGSAALGLGLSLGGVAAFAGSRAVDLHREGERLIADNPDPDDAARAKREQLAIDYRAKQDLAVGTAIAGGVALIVGTALVAVGATRLRRGSSRTAFTPAFGGLVFHARF